MDLGATVCTPRAPACGRCPWVAACRGRRAGIAAELPRRAKPAQPVRRGIAYLALQRGGGAGRDAAGARAPRRHARSAVRGVERGAGAAGPAVRGGLAADGAEVRHTFTHFHLPVDRDRVGAGALRGAHGPGSTPQTPALGAALPTVMRKALSLGLSALA